MIDVNSLNKYYNKGKNNEIHVINNTTIAFEETGFVTFLGASGSGKTTLLNVVGGLDKAKGTIKYEDTVIKGYKASAIDKYRSKNIGYVFQNYNLLRDETVYENLRLALEFIGINDKAEIEKRVKVSLEAVSMYKYRKRLAGALSGGQQQRISIARALVKNAKIIIADEPTGNLDSTNSIAVMNILKELSKTKLVLLVTHDKEYAKFYSDRVLGIKDGKLIHDFKNEPGVSSINTKDERVVYLGDLSSKEISGQGLNITTYKDDESVNNNIDLKVVYKNGVFYIDSNQNIKVVRDSLDIKISENKYEPYSKTNQETFVYDTSNFDSTLTKKSFDVRNFFKSLYISFLRFRHVRILTKLLNLSLALIGIVIAILIIVYSYATHIDDSNSSYLNGYNSLQIEDENTSTYSFFKENYNSIVASLLENNNLIDFIPSMNTISINNKVNGSLSANSGNSNSFSNVYILRSSSLNESDLKAGSLPTSTREIVLDEKVIENISAYSGNFIDISGNKIIGKDVNLNEKTYVVSGISNLNDTAVYLNDIAYYYNSNNDYLRSDDNYYQQNISLIAKNMRFKQDSTYSILTGRDINLNEGDEIEVVASTGLMKEYGYYVGQYIAQDVIIVGETEGTEQFTIIDKNFETKSSYVENSFYNYYSGIFGEFDLDDNSLVSGTAPSSETDLVVSKYLGLEVNDTITLRISRSNSFTEYDFKITGLTDSIYTDVYYLSHNAYLKNVSIGSNYFYDPLLKVKDVNSPNKIFAEKEFPVTAVDSKYNTYKTLEAEAKSSNRGLLITSAVLVGVAIVYIYFIMRSKMLKQIYTIGVYRALGAKKGRIYKMFLSDIFVTTTLTTFLGYFLVVIGYNNSIGSLANTIGIYKISTLYFILGIVGLYFVNFLFGLLPLFMLLRKAPSEIISKYDI